MKTIDLNCDLGESYGKFSSAYDEQIMPFISSCNIAAGFHSGDPKMIDRTIQLALKHDVAIGAHPSYPDLQGFGRRIMQLSEEEIRAVIRYQVSAVKGMAEAHGAALHHIKPHGALYNHASADPDVADAVMSAWSDWIEEIPVYAPYDSELAHAASKRGIEVIFESFADRCYEEDGSLRSRAKEGALITDKEKVLQQIHKLVFEEEVVAFGGKTIPQPARTICLHSDTTGAIGLARAINDYLSQNGVEIVAA